MTLPTSVLYSILVLIILGIAAFSLLWRYASRRYRLPCPVWMRGFLDTPFTRGISTRTRRTIERLELRSGMKVLDAGCGYGRLTIPIADRVGPQGEVTAIDIQESMLQKAEERARAAGFTNIRFLSFGLGERGLDRNRFDRAVLVTVLGEIPDREAALQEIFQSLRPGGILLIEETIRDPHFQSHSTVRRLANAAGFRERDFHGSRFSFALTLQKPSFGWTG